MFVVFDIDGTVLDGSHKKDLLPHAKPGEPWPVISDEQWEVWYEACADDKAIDVMLSTAYFLWETGNQVEFWTGRYEKCRPHTQDWLLCHGFPAHLFPLRMRPLDEREDPDHIVKERFIERFGRPDLVFEDRQCVVDMWRKNGIMCAQVAPGDY